MFRRHGLQYPPPPRAAAPPESGWRRAVHTRRYQKQLPGHQVQVDVKFLALQKPGGQRLRRYQYTAIDDATRIRALRVYRRHTQQNASPSWTTSSRRSHFASTPCSPTAVTSSKPFYTGTWRPGHPPCLHQAPDAAVEWEGRAIWNSCFDRRAHARSAYCLYIATWRTKPQSYAIASRRRVQLQVFALE